MAFQPWQQHFSRHITTITNRQSVNDEAGAPRVNNPVQMGSSNPFATTMENPWLGMNHMLLGSNNMVIHGQTNPMTSTHSGPANSLPDDRRKRPRVSTENQVHNFSVNFPVPSSSLESIKNEMIALTETDRMLCQQSKKVRMQYADKQSEAMSHLVDSVTTPILKRLKEKDEETVNMGKLNMELQEKVKNVFHVNQAWKEYATSCELKAMSLSNDLEDVLAEVSRLQGLVRSYGAVATPPEEQDVKSYCESNGSGKNTKRKTQGCTTVKVEEIKKVQTGAAETGEGSGEKKMCKSCGKMEMSFLGMPCRHLCFCIVCGIRESPLNGPCPVCASTMTATIPVSLV